MSVGFDTEELEAVLGTSSRAREGWAKVRPSHLSAEPIEAWNQLMDARDQALLNNDLDAARRIRRQLGVLVVSLL